MMRPFISKVSPDTNTTSLIIQSPFVGGGQSFKIVSVKFVSDDTLVIEYALLVKLEINKKSRIAVKRETPFFLNTLGQPL